MQNYVNTQYCNSGSKQKRYGVRLTVIQNSQDITNNRSNVTITFELGGAGALGLTTDYTGSSMNGFTYNGNIYVNGTSVKTGSYTGNINNSTVVTLATWTDNINHNPDGTLSINVKGVFTGGVSSQANGGEASGTVYFDNIPRASSVACTTANIGAKPTITITSAVSSFTHKLYYEFGTITKTLIADSGLTGNTTITYNNWTIPTTFYAQIPNSPSGTGNIICETYTGTTLIGTKSVSFTANVPSSAKPNISNPTIVDTDTVSKNTIKLYVIGKSKLQFTFPPFSTSYSSTLKNYTLNINGTQVYSGTDTTYTMSTPLTQAANTYELIITDSRNISNTTGTKNLTTAYAYSPPTCSITAERNASTSTTINIVYSGTITNINSNNKNAKSFKIEYKQSTASSWTTVSGFPVTNAYTKSNVAVNVTGISDSNTYDFRITATDSYGSATATVQIGTSATLLNFNANGATLAFGKASEIADTMEVNIKSKFLKELNVTSASNLKLNGTAISTYLLKLAYPIGAFYTTSSSTNPSSTFGFGTWVEKNCHEIIESNTITATGIELCRYRIFADGTFELEAITSSYNMNSVTSHTATITFPYTVTNAVCVCSLYTGGSNFPNTNGYSNMSGSTITIYRWNFGGGTAQSLKDSVMIKGTLDLASNNISTIHRFERTN